MAGRPSANAAHEKRLNLPRLRGETRRRTASSAPPSGRSLADGWCHPGASTTHTRLHGPTVLLVRRPAVVQSARHPP